jgi:hypothetical protein
MAGGRGARMAGGGAARARAAARRRRAGRGDDQLLIAVTLIVAFRYRLTDAISWLWAACVRRYDEGTR